MALVLTICSGNICRSPMAQALLGRGLAPLGIDVRSAGTIAVDGHPVTSEITELLHSEGVVDFAHGSRFMSERILAEADLVFAMTAGHRQDIVRALREDLRLGCAAASGCCGGVDVGAGEPQPSAGADRCRVRAPTGERT